MFSGVRLNNLFYILEKGDELKLKTGNVVSISNPMFGLNYGTTVDISVKVDDEVVEFKNLQATSSIANSGDVIVSDNKESMLNEVESIMQSSLNTLDKIDYHKRIIKDCDKIINTLNPSLAKEKERDEDISKLKDLIGDLDTKMNKILTILSKTK